MSAADVSGESGPKAQVAAVCVTCNGETWIVAVEAQCDGGEHEHDEGCMSPIQVTCPSCTTLRERQPNPAIDTGEPF